MKYILIIMVLLYGTALYGQSVKTALPPRAISWEDIIDYTHTTSNAADTINFPNVYRLYHIAFASSEDNFLAIGGVDLIGDTADYEVQYRYTDPEGNPHSTWSTYAAGVGSNYLPGTSNPCAITDFVTKSLFVKMRIIIGKGTTQSVSRARLRVYRMVMR